MPGPGPYTVSGGGNVTGGVVDNDSGVTNALNYVNNLSQTLGGNAGLTFALTASQTISCLCRHASTVAATGYSTPTSVH